MVKEPPFLVVRVFIPHSNNKNTTVALRFPTTTRTHQVIEKLCQRFQPLQIPNLDTYMLYVEERPGEMYTLMSENELISAYNLSVRSMLGAMAVSHPHHCRLVLYFGNRARRF